jgi:hypothetical protein
MTPWLARVLVPILTLVAVLGLIHDHTAPAVFVPIVVLAAGVWIYAAERSGLYVTDWGLESRMTRRNNSFRYAWTDIDHFKLVNNGAQVAIVMYLAAGKPVLLPSTRAPALEKRRVERILAELERELVAAQSRSGESGRDEPDE